ncbi:MAG: hypothetical protein IJA34_00670 [Lachnospiraceae bacterium]|nr:hypothetical protein [Lachnospiraceae bacterium]
MSYTIIFETKIVKLSDGRLIHFDRSGCNNDNAGRKKDDFSARIYTEEEFIKKAKKMKENNKPYKESGEFELKIGSRYATSFDYGEHLLRMLKRAKPYADFIKSIYFRIEHLTGIQLHRPEEKFMTVEEFDKEFYNLLYSGGGMSYTRLIEYPDISDEENLVKLIENKAALQFEIRSKK